MTSSQVAARSASPKRADSAARVSDPGDQIDLVRDRVVDVLANELARRRGVVAEAAAQRRARLALAADRQRQRALRADERAVGDHLDAVADEPALGARLGAVDAAELGLGLAGVAGVGREMKRSPVRV